MSAARGQLGRVADGWWLMAAGDWLPAISHQLPATSYQLSAISHQPSATFQFDQQANCEYPYKSVSDCVKFSYR